MNELDKLIQRIPELAPLKDKLIQLAARLAALYKNDGVLYLAGNGGSCCDAEHIAGELLKGFKKRRPLNDADKAAFSAFGEKGQDIGAKLQQGLRAVTLNSHPGFCTAFCNDVDPDLVFAQQLNALGRKGDVFLGISTGGGAKNIEAAFITAKVRGITTVLFTGNKHGRCEQYADIIIDIPAGETYLIQEYHLAVYHAVCAYIEEVFFTI